MMIIVTVSLSISLNNYLKNASIFTILLVISLNFY